jgi:hypothetical protein
VLQLSHGKGRKAFFFEKKNIMLSLLALKKKKKSKGQLVRR